jgi:UDP-4-amino-4,6-dideoxy-N-acetyl-beta-L-altrosamine transaminase
VPQEAAKPTLPYLRQHIDSTDIAAVSAVLRSEWLTSGPAIPALEEAVAAYCGARFAVAVANGTAGLHAACHALGIGPGDRVWTSPNSFVASANCALYCGATVDFVDIDPVSYNLSLTELERKLTAAAQSNSLPQALIAIHFAGQPCDLKEIAVLLAPYGISLIEDATHALGATYCGERIGSCRFSEATVFSFHATKSIAAGEGGMVLTNRDDLRERIIRFRAHGIVRTDPDDALEPWRYEQVELGFNYRLTDIQAALGLSQLGKLDAFIARRKELGGRYDEALKGLRVQLPHCDLGATSARHLYPIQITAEKPAALRRQLFAALLQGGIRSQVHYIPIHTQPYYRELGFRFGDFPAAERYYEGALSLPLFYDLGESDQDRVIAIVRATLR